MQSPRGCGALSLWLSLVYMTSSALSPSLCLLPAKVNVYEHQINHFSPVYRGLLKRDTEWKDTETFKTSITLKCMYFTMHINPDTFLKQKPERKVWNGIWLPWSASYVIRAPALGRPAGQHPVHSASALLSLSIWILLYAIAYQWVVWKF